MKILQICNKPPFPPKDGGGIAMNAITIGLLSSGHTVKVIALNSKKFNITIDEIPEEYKKDTNIELVDIDLSISPISAFLNLFSKNSYHIQRFISQKFENKIIEVLKNESFDIIQLESLFVTPYIEVIRKHSNAKIVLRAHNVEHVIWERMANSSNNLFKKFYISHLAKTLKYYEVETLNKVDGIVPITTTDLEQLISLGAKKPLCSIPVACGIPEQWEHSTNSDSFKLFHIGSMNWQPNLEAIQWFIYKIWPIIQSKSSNITLHLAGRNMPKWLLELNSPNIFVDGEIEDAGEYLRDKHLMIVPLLSGSGMRVKIIEGLAFGKAIISTTFGAEGIDTTDNKNIIIADKEEDFAERILNIAQKPDVLFDIERNARLFAEERYSMPAVNKELISYYHTLTQ